MVRGMRFCNIFPDFACGLRENHYVCGKEWICKRKKSNGL